MANETYAPSVTINATGNGIAAGSLAANASSSYTIDATGLGSTGTGTSTTALLGLYIHFSSTPGASVSATNGLQITVVPGVGTTPTFDTNGTQIVIPSVASTLASITLFFQGGQRYQVTVKNLDATNALTSVSSTYDTINNTTSNP